MSDYSRIDEALAAVETLERLGYTYKGGEIWEPPLGREVVLEGSKAPLFLQRHDRITFLEQCLFLVGDSLPLIVSDDTSDDRARQFRAGYRSALMESAAKLEAFNREYPNDVG